MSEMLGKIMLTTKELLHHIERADKVRIDLGCGMQKSPGFIGIDQIELPGIDYVADLEKGLPFLPDNCVDEYVATHFLEHIGNLEILLSEIHRTVKSDGTIKIVVPYFANPYYYSDHTHKRFFGLYTFDYFSKEPTGYTRKVPNFYTTFHFKVIERGLNFKSPFPVRNLIKKAFGKIVNLNHYFQEFYEENMPYIFPAQEIYYLLKKSSGE